MIFGIDQNSPLDALLEMGARQFYTGYVPQVWLNLYSCQISPNRRYRIKEQFSDLAVLASSGEKIRCAGGQLYLALNIPFVTPAIKSRLLSLAQTLIDFNPAGLIVGSITMLELLLELGYDKIVISSLLGCYSAEAVDFFIKTYAPSKIVLPRDLTLTEIGQIVSAHPDTSFEVFLFGDHCRLSESYCFVEHGYDSVIRQDLCHFALAKKSFHLRPAVNFKRVIQDSGLSAEAKRKKIAGTTLTFGAQLDHLSHCMVECDHQGTTQVLECLARMDYSHELRASPALVYRALVILKACTHPMVDAVLTALQSMRAAIEAQAPSDIQAFYQKLGSAGIGRALDFFSQYDNIVSYKVPARGRNALQMLTLAVSDQKDPDYRQVLYQS